MKVPARHSVVIARVTVVASVLGLLVTISSCFLFPTPPPPPAPDPWRTTPKVAMSEEYMKSRTGDIMVFLPRGWFVLNSEDMEYEVEMMIEQE